jgi:hypothetical protein
MYDYIHTYDDICACWLLSIYGPRCDESVEFSLHRFVVKITCAFKHVLTYVYVACATTQDEHYAKVAKAQAALHVSQGRQAIVTDMMRQPWIGREKRKSQHDLFRIAVYMLVYGNTKNRLK